MEAPPPPTQVEDLTHHAGESDAPDLPATGTEEIDVGVTGLNTEDNTPLEATGQSTQDPMEAGVTGLNTEDNTPQGATGQSTSGPGVDDDDDVEEVPRQDEDAEEDEYEQSEEYQAKVLHCQREGLDIGDLNGTVVRNAEEVLAAIDPEDIESATAMNILAGAIADHHLANDMTGDGDLPRAIELVKRAIELTPEDYYLRGTFYSSLLTINYRWSVSAGLPEKFDDSIYWGRKACAPLPIAYQNHTMNHLYTRRCQNLTRSLRAKYEHKNLGGNLQDLDSALRFAAKALDETCVCDDCGENFGHSRMDYRRSEFCSLLCLRSEATYDIDPIDAAIKLRLMLPVYGNISNIIGLIYLLARKYEWTKETEDLDKLVAMASKLYDPPADPDTQRPAILGYLAGFMSREYNNRGERNMQELNCAIHLSKEAITATGFETENSFLLMHDLVVQLTALAEEKWQITKTTRDADEADKIELQNCHMSILRRTLISGTKFEDLESMLTICTVYTRRRDGQQMTEWPDNFFTGEPQKLEASFGKKKNGD